MLRSERRRRERCGRRSVVEGGVCGLVFFCFYFVGSRAVSGFFRGFFSGVVLRGERKVYKVIVDMVKGVFWDGGNSLAGFVGCVKNVIVLSFRRDGVIGIFFNGNT